ncbi:MAG: DUF3422 family protein [Nitrospirae bacterium]|nr:DUF3422 family protein [Nitrospirota bacterium]
MEIKLYRLSTCHWCDAVEEFLNEHNFSYEGITIDNLNPDEQEKIISEVYSITGQRSFPVTLLDGGPVIGFDEKKLRHFLNLPPREGPRKTASKVVKEIFTSDQRKVVREWAIGVAEEFGCLLNPKEEDLINILDGLMKNERRYGYRSCPCRFSTGDYKRDADIICPCAYVSWDLEVYGRCYCALYVTEKYISGDPALPEYFVDSRETPREDLEKEISQEKSISVPLRSYIRIVSYYLTKDTDRESLKDRFSELVKSLGIDPKEIKWKESIGVASGRGTEGGNLLIKMEQAMDLYTYQIWLPEERDLSFPKNPVVDAGIFIYGTFPGNEIINLHLKGKEEFGCILDDGLKIYSSFKHLRGERDNFIFVADPVKISEEYLERIIGDIIKLENCYYLLRDQRQKYILASDRINQIDAGVIGKIGTINLNLPKSTHENLKEWLHSLSTLLGDVSSILEEVRHYSADTISRIEIINNILIEWKETPLETLPLTGSFYGKATLTLGDDYQRLSRRIEGIKGEMMDLITILRTKVDLITQEQSLELQKSMDETTKTQVKLQKTVEGLSVIVISYYIVALAKYIFDGVKAAGLIDMSTTLLTAIFVPLAIIISFFLVRESKKWWMKEK